MTWRLECREPTPVIVLSLRCLPRGRGGRCFIVFEAIVLSSSSILHWLQFMVIDGHFWPLHLQRNTYTLTYTSYVVWLSALFLRRLWRHRASKCLSRPRRFHDRDIALQIQFAWRRWSKATRPRSWNSGHVPRHVSKLAITVFSQKCQPHSSHYSGPVRLCIVSCKHPTPRQGRGKEQNHLFAPFLI